jgi:hypothetical protein
LVSFINAMNLLTSAILRNLFLILGVYQYRSVCPVEAPDVRSKVRFVHPVGQPPSIGSSGTPQYTSLGVLVLDFLPLVAAGIVFLFASGKILAAAAGGGAFFDAFLFAFGKILAAATGGRGAFFIEGSDSTELLAAKSKNGI